MISSTVLIGLHNTFEISYKQFISLTLSRSFFSESASFSVRIIKMIPTDRINETLTILSKIDSICVKSPNKGKNIRKVDKINTMINPRFFHQKIDNEMGR
jgi:hypothetical protein